MLNEVNLINDVDVAANVRHSYNSVGVDLNTLVESGEYEVRNFTNGPDGGSFDGDNNKRFMLKVARPVSFGNDAIYTSQEIQELLNTTTATNNERTRKWIRRQYNGVWREWRQVTNYLHLSIGPAGSDSDYVVDGVDDHVQIAAADAEIAAAGGGELHFRPFTYNAGATLQPSSNVSWMGPKVAHFSQIVVIQASVAMTDLIQITSTTPGVLADLTLSGLNGNSTNGVAIVKDALPKIKNPRLDNLVVENFSGSGIYGVSTGIPSGPYDDAVWNDLRIRNNGVGIANWGTNTNLFGGVVGGNDTGIQAVESSSMTFYGTVFSVNDTELEYMDNFVQLYSFNETYHEGATVAHVERNVAAVTDSIGGLVYTNCRFTNAMGSTVRAWDLSNLVGDVTFNNCDFPTGASSRRIFHPLTTTVRINGYQNGVRPIIVGTAGLLGPLFMSQQGSVFQNTATAKNISPFESNTVFIGNTVDTTFNLPSAQQGLIFTFVVGQQGFNVTVNTASGDQFANTQTTTTSGVQAGDAIQIEAIDNTNWVVRSVSPQWSGQSTFSRTILSVSTIQIANFTAEAGVRHLVDSGITVSSPANPYPGMTFGVVDATASFGGGANSTVVDFGTDNFYGSTGTDTLNTAGDNIVYKYVDATTGWIREQ